MSILISASLCFLTFPTEPVRSEASYVPKKLFAHYQWGSPYISFLQKSLDSRIVDVTAGPVQSPRKRIKPGAGRNWPFVWTLAGRDQTGSPVTLTLSAPSSANRYYNPDAAWEYGTAGGARVPFPKEFGVRDMPRPGLRYVVLGKAAEGRKVSFFQDDLRVEHESLEAYRDNEFAVFAYFKADESRKSKGQDLVQVYEVIDSKDLENIYELAGLVSKTIWHDSQGLYPQEHGKIAAQRAHEEKDPLRQFAWHFIAWCAGHIESGIKAREAASKIEEWPIPRPNDMLIGGFSRYFPDSILLNLMRDESLQTRALRASANAKTPEARWYCLWPGLGPWQEKWRPLCIKILEDSVRDNDFRTAEILVRALCDCFAKGPVARNEDPVEEARTWIQFLKSPSS